MSTARFLAYGGIMLQEGMEYAKKIGGLLTKRKKSYAKLLNKACGLNLVVAAIVLCNTVYPERAVQRLKPHGPSVDDTLLTHLSPLAWQIQSTTPLWGA